MKVLPSSRLEQVRLIITSQMVGTEYLRGLTDCAETILLESKKAKDLEDARKRVEYILSATVEMTPKATLGNYAGTLVAGRTPSESSEGHHARHPGPLLKLRGLLTTKPGEELSEYALEALRPLRMELGARRLTSAPVFSTLVLSSILLGLLEDRLDEAAEEAKGAAAAKGYPPLPRRLFRELAEAIRAYKERGGEAREALIEAVLKLFYLHL